MPPQSSSQDLAQAMAALEKSLYILIIHYKGYLKFIVLMIFVYVFYRLGHKTVKDQQMNQKHQLSELIERRIAVRVEIPKKIQKLRQLNNTILILAVLLLISYGIGSYMKIRLIRKNSSIILAFIMGSAILTLTLLNFYKQLLQKKFRQNDTLQRTISKQLTEFQTSLGPKVNKILKNHLCKQKLSKLHSSLYSNECVKPNCKQLRNLYKVRVEAMEQLVNDVINFEWCSICRKHIPFDEYLEFEYRTYQERGDSQEQEVRHKMMYLVQGIDKMNKWLSVTSPCNCSKLYWAMSTEKILSYKRTVRNTEDKLKLLQSIAYD